MMNYFAFTKGETGEQGVQGPPAYVHQPTLIKGIASHEDKYI